MNRPVKIGADGSEQSADVTDHAAVLIPATGLMWSAQPLGSKALTWKAADKAVQKLELAGYSDWRLPTVEELFLLADRSRFNPAIDTDLFPGTKSDWYWASSPDASDPDDYAWIVYFDYGSALIDGRYNLAFVRAVRSVPASPAGQ